jgi:hypothetical protein
VTAPDATADAAGIHDLHVRLVEPEWVAVRAVAQRVRMPVSVAVRLLVLRGLEQEAAEPTPAVRRRGAATDARQGDRELALATLLAAEHALLVLTDMSPGGTERAARLADRAGVAAQRRLERVAAALPEVSR